MFRQQNIVRILAWGIAGYAAYKFMQKLLPGVQAAVNQAAKAGRMSAAKATRAVGDGDFSTVDSSGNIVDGSAKVIH